MSLDFNENEIIVLSAANGRGKTTLLSYIVDAWYEMAKKHFGSEVKDKKYYRVASNVYNMSATQPSFVYIRFQTPEGCIDYIDILDIRGKVKNYNQGQYDEAIQLKDKIPLDAIKRQLKQYSCTKYIWPNFDENKAEKIFRNNIVTYFPSYRYETPGYLNDTYKINLSFEKERVFSSDLNNPIEVITGLPQLANWIMDVVLDSRQQGYGKNDKNPSENNLLGEINKIITRALISKKFGEVEFNIGQRNLKGVRIGIKKLNEDPDKKINNVVYPTIFDLSSGEAAMFCLFGEILRQADNNKNNMPLSDITGIVLIDEVDKHLHIKLQKEVLPELFKLFPNVQFILSSHAPFLNMGLAEVVKERTKIVDLDNFGISNNPSTSELYNEVYKMMISENERFKEEYDSLKNEINSAGKPLILTEGKTDVMYLKKAKEVLGIEDCDIDFSERKDSKDSKDSVGDVELRKLLKYVSKIKPGRKIIGIFDRDNDEIVKDIEKDDNEYKKYSDEVYAFCIPFADQGYGDSISIEHYFRKEDLCKEDENGRRLFLGDEFYESGNSKNGKFQTNTASLKNKIEKNGVMDEKVYKNKDLKHADSIALSKGEFASLVTNNAEFIEDFDFSNFNLIFDKIKRIIQIIRKD
ncbi:AAA family ATPase [Candidatus Endomicrobiellum agilis]|uniref:AAA family ATPase n=1 Tax=Candidatus Endomicrobiellum agilis TaxID=3238957 RepID=UPI00357DF85B|nr:AAA family ATPase [Endomicrobium sp.]